MGTTFEYSVVRIEPDVRRGERVNVGVVVFNGQDLDIRIIDTRKAAAISSSSQNWDAYVQVFASNLKELFSAGRSASDLVEMVEALGRQVNLTKTGWFNAKDIEEYEWHVKRIVESLIARPKVARRARETSIASEIASVFKSAEILSAPHESLENGKVIRNFTVDEGAGLVADFALQNGFLHLATTVNLTSTNPHIGSSASKAITMDMARRANALAKAYCVYAVAPSRKAEVREHISLLGDYSDAIFNWHEPDENRKFKQVFYDAYNSNHPTGIEQRISQD